MQNMSYTYINLLCMNMQNMSYTYINLLCMNNNKVHRYRFMIPK